MPPQRQKQFGLCSICRVNHDQGKGHKYSLKHKKHLREALYKFHAKIEEVLYFVKNPTLLLSEDKAGNKFWCLVCRLQLNEDHSSFACSNAIRHLASAEHMECLKSFWIENGADVQHRDMYHIFQQDFSKWENTCKEFKRASMSLGGSDHEDLNNIHCKHYSINVDTVGSVSINMLANNLSDSVLPLQQFKDQSFQVFCQGVNGASAANLASQGACLLTSSERINADQESISEYAQDVKHKHSFSKSGLLHRATVGDFLAQQHSISTTSASTGQDCFHLQAHGGYNKSNSLQDGYQGALQLTCIQTAVLPGEAKENIHTGATPPWWKMDGGDEVILSKEAQTSADLQNLLKNQERKLKKMRNPKRVGASWAEQRKSELERQVNEETSSKNVASDASWLPNFGRVWQSGSRKDSRREFVADRTTGKTFVTKTENTVELQPYITKRMKLESKLTS